MSLKYQRFFQVIRYGWTDAKSIATQNNAYAFAVYLDILKHYRLYGLWSFHYKKDNLWNKSEEQKKEIAQRVGDLYKQRDLFVQYRFDERRFLAKYSSMKYDTSSRLMKKRGDAYRRHYHLDDSCIIQYGLILMTEHYTIGELKVGKSCFLGRNVDIDYTGGLTVGDHVSIMDGVKILTHAHDSFNINNDNEYIPFSNYAFRTPLTIGENTSIGSRAIIMPGVSEIGENVMISAGAVVKEKVPSNCIVAGNPAKVIAKIPRGLKRVYETSLSVTGKHSSENRELVVEHLDETLPSKQRKETETSTES